MYFEDQKETMSYFRIAGIHGMPYEPWGGSQEGYQEGYCAHGTVLFPTWHRPYIALFEVESLPLRRTEGGIHLHR